ncbi:hypothetical protein SAMN04489713_12799 [Actinomadura madurae]|uniref:DUF4333 domain-containing protein n=1 Tax=Actinomadura madurae TaxID=1993 RepID=A0A1I5XMS5_9ACTN|nr:hypothetical protein [Actinomadura madurae]SFQ33271.1 hypothetical protein SAMN04489713_12799 [Actinomadura madurae]
MPPFQLPARLKVGRRTALIIGSAGLLVLVAVGGGAFVLLSGRDELTYKTQAALRNALPVTAAAELRERGVTLASPLKCADLPGWTKTKMRVSCHGTTSDKRPVEVIGSGEQRTKKSYYTILVGGRPVVENAPCLGADCAKEEG